MTTLRTCLAISVAIHVVIMLWLALGPGARTLAPASAEPILVDLVAPQDAPKTDDQKTDDQKTDDQKTDDQKTELLKAEEPKPEQPGPTPRASKTAAAKTEPPKTQPPKTEPPKTEPPKTESAKTGPNVNQQQAAPKIDPKKDPKNDSEIAAQDSAEERAATAARLAWMLNLPTDTSTSLAAPPSEDKSNLAREEIAEFKAQVSKCWVAPAGIPNTPDANVLIRVAFNRDGTLGAMPELIAAPVSIDGRPLAESAKRALRKCQPYATLPTAKYRDWKILDMSFTAQGPAGLSGPPGSSGSATH